MTKTITLEFQGYWLDANKALIPAESGVYCVYACTYNPGSDSVEIRKLLYIGESIDVRQRIANHNKLRDWYSQLGYGETLCYSYAKVGSLDRERCEAALIFHHKPPLNSEFLWGYPFGPTIVQITSASVFLDPIFRL